MEGWQNDDPFQVTECHCMAITTSLQWQLTARRLGIAQSQTDSTEQNQVAHIIRTKNKEFITGFQEPATARHPVRPLTPH